MGKLQNKIVVITGGTTGIGLAAAHLFESEGAKVTVTGINPETLEAARTELRGVAEVMASDAGSQADIEKLARTFDARGAGVDVLFLNAGLARFGPIDTLDVAVFDEIFRINVRGPWLAVKYFGPLMRRGGAIVVNSSMNNRLGMSGSSVYAASKAAVRSLVRTAASELADAGIRVNAVSPGPIETPIYGKLGLSPEVVQGFSKELIARMPLKRFGTSGEVAKAALFLASDDSSYMTGGEIVLDGGMTQV
ncbi:MAG TPA: SDR family oxidoreductase [Polyangiaceae bacterium]|nr:SDR family oxidoreductase [Polyangiaceae bacterium]